jgi:hypothetical protein
LKSLSRSEEGKRMIIKMKNIRITDFDYELPENR